MLNHCASVNGNYIPFANEGNITYHDGSEPTSSSLSLQSHPGYGPQGIFIHIKVTLKNKQEAGLPRV